MEDSTPHLRIVRKYNRRRGRAGKKTALRSPSAQEMEEGIDKDKAKK
jgi:hypothetical protein